MASIEKRQNANGEVSYRVKVRLKGRPEEHSTFTRLTDARRWAQSVETAIREGRSFKSSRARKHTLADAILRFKKDVLPLRPGCARAHPRQLDWWSEKLGPYALCDVTPSLIAECKLELLNTSRRPRRANHKQIKELENRSPATVNRYLAALSRVFTYAVKEWGWIDENPVRRVFRLEEPKGRTRFLSADERTALLKACRKSDSPFLYPVVILALATGMRRGEILSLTWSQIDFESERITLFQTKNKEVRSLPLVGLAKQALLELPAVSGDSKPNPDEMVFPGPTKGKQVDLTTGWKNALKVAGIANFRFHDLRHSTASYLAANKASLLEIATVLGHKTLAMVKRYSHLQDDQTRTVVTAMNDRIFAPAPPACEAKNG